VKAVAAGLVAIGALVALPTLVVLMLVGSLAGPGSTAPSLSAIPDAALAAYVTGAAACPGLSWSVLAAIGEVESDHGRSALPGVHAGANPAGAEGPMQMLPATFAAYALAGPAGAPDPYDLTDEAVAAARMLCADGGGDPARLTAAVFAYNHDLAYVDDVLTWAARYGAAPAGGSDPGRGEAALSWALQQLGAPYRWGSAGPDSFDCSGLVMRAWQAAGLVLPRVAAQQYGAGAHIPVAQARAGDLVFFASDSADPLTIEHVGLALGDGRMVDAPFTGAMVRIDGIGGPGLVPLATRPG
jgi:cell wall-associated NlpC family hydrolase